MAQKRTWLGEPDKWARQRRIESLDVERDFLEISGLTSGDFRSIILPVPFAGFMTTFAAPRMSRILCRSGELTDRFAKRAVDTMLFAKAIHEHGFGTGDGRAAARKVNALHAQYDIHPDDFVLVGLDPMIFILDMFDTYGWRPLLQKEHEAQRIFFDRQARAFGSRRPLPKTEAEMRAFADHYFDTQLHYEPQNRVMADKALEWFTSLAPKPLRFLMRRMLLAPIDPRVLRACGMKPLSAIDSAIGKAGLRLMARRDPIPDGAPDMLQQLVAGVYPNGYTVADLGPRLKSEVPQADDSDGAHPALPINVEKMAL